MKYGASFGQVDTANQIFSLTYAKDYKNDGVKNLLSIKNGSKDRPKLGDLLIWEQTFPDFPFGHVAVIVGVNFGDANPHILVAEQNYDNGWDARTYSRTLKVYIDIGGGITVLNQRIVIPGREIERCRDYKGSIEASILGWVRLQ